jgi:hypothetical protein
MPFTGFSPEDQEFMQLFGTLAPQGLPWRDWPQSGNVERTVGLDQLKNYTPARQQATGIHYPTTMAGGLLSQQAGYNDIDQAALFDLLRARGMPEAPSQIAANVPVPRPRPR